MATTKKATYDAEYKKAHYDNVVLRVYKGKREEYQQAAQDLGIGFWDLLQSGVEEFIASHIWSDFSPVKPASITPPPAQKLSAEERNLLAEFNQLPADVQKSLLKLAKSINANQTANVDSLGAKTGV